MSKADVLEAMRAPHRVTPRDLLWDLASAETRLKASWLDGLSESQRVALASQVLVSQEVTEFMSEAYQELGTSTEALQVIFGLGGQNKST